jgi:hypothetical protein
LRQDRSTRSTRSQDEFDYKKSVLTRTSQNSEDFTIKDSTVKVDSQKFRFKIGGAQIDCLEGGEVVISRQPGTITREGLVDSWTEENKMKIGDNSPAALVPNEPVTSEPPLALPGDDWPPLLPQSSTFDPPMLNQDKRIETFLSTGEILEGFGEQTVPVGKQYMSMERIYDEENSSDDSSSDGLRKLFIIPA